MLHNFKLMVGRMSFKVQMRHDHLAQFKDNLGALQKNKGMFSLTCNELSTML